MSQRMSIHFLFEQSQIGEAMNFPIISDEEVRSFVKPHDAIRAIEEVLTDYASGAAVNIPRIAIKGENSTYRIMSGAMLSKNIAGTKQGIWSSDIKSDKKLAMMGELVTLYDMTSGELLALVNSHYLNEIRTGASGAVGTKYLSNKESCRIALLGSSHQARTLLLCTSLVRQIDEVKVYSRTEKNRDEFCKKIRDELPVKVRSVASSSEAVKDSDIILEATSSKTPVFDGSELKSGSHVTAIGTGFNGASTIDEAAVKRSGRMFVLSKEQARSEKLGDVLNPLRHGIIDWDDVFEISDLIVGKVKGRASLDDITLYKANGIALIDLAIAMFVYECVKN
ncbi:MAG: ornithine cyclodeaminase family protein [Thaumarchaeota archaeon]|nr:ornithine cyclodeaminase family protein [Nitrososphaerota archaeon]